jgi:hypothetical protein
VQIKTKHVLQLAILIILTACSSKKTERELYEDAKSGITYRTYKTTSDLVVATSVKGYNLQQPDSLQLQPVYAHLMLGYFWSVSGKPSLAFAEADIASESPEGNVKFLAQTLNSITMYQQGWHALAKEESTLATQHLDKKPDSKITYEASIFYLIMGTLYVKEKDFSQASFFWAGFGNETGINWPYQLSDAAAELQKGNIQTGLQKIKVITQDPTVPKALRDVLAIQITKVEQNAGSSVDSSLFWPRLIGKLLWQELKSSTDKSLQKIISITDGVQKKLGT